MKLRYIACAAMVFARAYAQETGPVVQVKASADIQRQQDTAARIVVTREQILAHGDTSVNDVLKRLPGVNVADGAPRLRGLGNGYTQILVNGERPPTGFSLDTLAPDMIEKIEVMRAATAEYSTQAVAGTINIVLRKTVGKPAGDVRSMLSVSPRGGTGGLGGSSSGKSDGFSYLVGANLFAGSLLRPELERTTHNGSAGELHTLRVDEGEVRDSWAWLNANSRLNWTLAPGHTLGWQTLLTATAFRANRATASEVLQGPPYPYADFHYRRRDHVASLRSDVTWSFKWASGLRFDSTAILELSDERRRRRSDAADTAGLPTLTRIYTTTPDSRRASWNGKFTFPVVEGHTVTAGWDASFTRQRDHETQREQPEEDFDRKLRADVARLAMYAQDEWEIGKQLSLYAGLRHEASRTATSGSDFAQHAVRSNVASPLLQALYKLPGDGKRQLRAALTRTFRAPDTGQLLPRRFRSIANSEVSPDSGGNPALRPEIARGVDIAYEHYLAEGAMWSVSAAERSIDDTIMYSVSKEDGRWISAPRNHGQARMRSLEMEAKLPMGATKFAFSLGRHWSDVDSVPGPDNRLASQTPWTGNASIDYRAGAWGAGGSAAFNGGAWSRQSESQSGYKPRTRALEAFLTYRPDAASLWRLTAIHALDHRLATASRYVIAQRVSESISYRRPDRALRIVYERKL